LSDHLLSKCSLFEEGREKIIGLHTAPLAITKEKILDKINNGPGLRALARKTCLGYGPDIGWMELRGEDEGSDDDKFGEFE
jgi:hypothetical protein